MKETDVPLIDQTTCQSHLRATRLGANFVLDAVSFMCAGGESGKGWWRLWFIRRKKRFPLFNLFRLFTDACTGDGDEFLNLNVCGY